MLLCEVFRKIYACSPHAADGERLFSEVGRIVTSDKTSLKDETLVKKAVTAADIRLREQVARETIGKRGRADRTEKRFVNSSEVLQRLRALGSNSRSGSGGEASQMEVIPIANVEEQQQLAPRKEELQVDTNHPERGPNLDDVVDEEGLLPMPVLDDECLVPISSEKLCATEVVYQDFSELRATVQKLAAEIGWDDIAGPVNEMADQDQTAEECAALARSLEKCLMGEIPSRDGLLLDDDLPRDTLFGSRGFKISLQVVCSGMKFPPLTATGRLVEEA